MELLTSRLRLRPLSPGDVDIVAALGADERVMKWFGSFPQKPANRWLERQLGHWHRHGFGRYVVSCGETFVGFVGLSRTDFDAGFVPGIEIAWRLVFEHWGKGYATEAARAVLDEGFGRLGFDAIVGITTPHNTRSRRVMERLGMTHAPEETFEHPAVPPGDPLRTHVVYRLSALP